MIKMNKKKIMILCSIIVGVVVGVTLLVFVVTRNNSIPANNNEEKTNNVIDDADNNVTDNIVNEENGESSDLPEGSTNVPEESTNVQPTNQKENNKNQNTDANTNVNTNASSEAQNQTTQPNAEAEPETSAINYGDVSEDGKINVLDLIFIKEYTGDKKQFTQNQLLAADVNTDGAVDDVDTDVLSKYISGGYDIDKLPYNSGEKYNITYDLNGGVVSNNKTLRSVYASISDIETLPTVVKDKYVFTGWTGSNGNVLELTVTPKSDTRQNLHYIANWELYGDVNEDGKINAGDILYINLYTRGEHEFTQGQLLAADVNVDGVINTDDSEIIRKYLAGGYGIDKLPYNP